MANKLRVKFNFSSVFCLTRGKRWTSKECWRELVWKKFALDN